MIKSHVNMPFLRKDNADRNHPDHFTQVFTALRGSQLHVPYRNSKLTQILRPCLGGDAKVSLSHAII